MKKGISLIVLVITIVVAIILFSVITINIIESGLITSTDEAKFKSNVKTYEVELSTVIFNSYLDNNNFDSSDINAESWSGEDSLGSIKEYISSISKVDGNKFKIVDSKLVYIGSDDLEKSWALDVGIECLNTFNVGDIAQENKSLNSEEFSCFNPVIPFGFKAVNTSDASWNNLSTDWDNGLVIEDENANQFVWVPVDTDVVNYTKDFSYPKCYSATFDNTGDDLLPFGIDNEIDQINKYGGFYIARYEAGKSNNKLVSKYGVDVWNKVIYSVAKDSSEDMYNNDFVKSGLITGTAWDILMSYIGSLENNVESSASWGNYINSSDVAEFGTLKTSGFYDNWKVKNIYDIAGNCYEWTTETYGSYRIYRGGSYKNSGTTKPASCREYGIGPGFAYDEVSFRVMLFVL